MLGRPGVSMMKIRRCATSFFLIFAVMMLAGPTPASAGLGSDSDGSFYIDPESGDKYYNYPPLELLEGKSNRQISDALKQWQYGVDNYLKSVVRDYFKCKADLTAAEEKLAAVGKKKEIETQDYEAAVLLLKRNLLAAMTRLGLQTAALIADGTTDLQVLAKSLKQTASKQQSQLKQAKARGEMLAEFHRLSTKAAKARQAA